MSMEYEIARERIARLHAEAAQARLLSAARRRRGARRRPNVRRWLRWSGLPLSGRRPVGGVVTSGDGPGYRPGTLA